METTDAGNPHPMLSVVVTEGGPPHISPDLAGGVAAEFPEQSLEAPLPSVAAPQEAPLVLTGTPTLVGMAPAPAPPLAPRAGTAASELRCTAPAYSRATSNGSRLPRPVAAAALSAVVLAGVTLFAPTSAQRNSAPSGGRAAGTAITVSASHAASAPETVSHTAAEAETTVPASHASAEASVPASHTAADSTAPTPPPTSSTPPFRDGTGATAITSTKSPAVVSARSQPLSHSAPPPPQPRAAWFASFPSASAPPSCKVISHFDIDGNKHFEQDCH